MVLRLFLIMIAGATTFGCATTRISLFTNPKGVQVYAKPLGSGRLQLLGETPLTVSASQIEKTYSGSGPVLMEFRKEGFQTETALITELSSQDLSINMEMVPSGGFEDLQRLNEVIETMFECQRLVKVHRYDEALKRLHDIKKQLPQISIIYEMEGGIYYLQRRYQDALDVYRLAIRYNPKNVEALRMRDLLEKTFGIKRSSASEEPPKPEPEPELPGPNP